ncbi:trimethylamine methyltransferase family protein [Desulfococcus sp.]|uniref:trimethylamine methyltransferase family protein n=1 Tax=Desulfococcus sp. TaxID=2025834 RepID=UPI003593FF1F
MHYQTLKQIDEASLNILETVGIRLHHPDIRQLVQENGIQVVGETAFFKPHQVIRWVACAPARFTLHARNPVHDMALGGDVVHYGAGYGCPAILAADGILRPALFEDYLTFVKLVHQSPLFHLNGGVIVQPTDLPPQQSALAMISAAICHSDKCLLGIPGDEDTVREIMMLVGTVFGGLDTLRRTPRIITLVNTTSPLQIDRIALGTIRACAEHGQPVIISPGPMAGATGPITLSGNIALGHAEALAGIAIAQMITPGTPVIYGLQATISDMKTGKVSIGSPGFAVQAAWGARLAKMYHLPCRGGGAGTDAAAISVQGGYESMMAMMVSCREKINLILHGAGILKGYGAMSYEKFFVDTEIIRMIEYLIADLDTSADALALDVIREVGPGGQYLTHMHTMKNCRRVPWLPEIGVEGLPREGTTHGAELPHIAGKKQKMLAEYRRPRLEESAERALLDYLGKIGLDLPRLIPA